MKTGFHTQRFYDKLKDPLDKQGQYCEACKDWFYNKADCFSIEIWKKCVVCKREENPTK